MFNRKTLFVIGAGAGYDIRMPVGRDLAESIYKRTHINLNSGQLGGDIYDEDLALNFFERGDPKANDYAQAFKVIRDGVLLCNSIDDFLNIHEASPAVVAVGKAAIVRTILYAERHSKLYVDTSNINNNKLNLVDIRDSWFVKFMQVLGPGRKAPNVESVLDDVAFINFNYDRCLEQFLRHALQLLYGIQYQRAAQIVSQANIIHPYGSVGTLEKVQFGGIQHARMDFREYSKGIKTYTERIEEPEVLSKMQAAIREAQCIVFLGFAYHKQNMALLKPPRSQKTRQIYGTAFQMSDKDVDTVVQELETLFPDNENSQPTVGPYGVQVPILEEHHNIRVENKLTCAQLFDHYAKSLAG